jgi:hypothetical protein
LQLALYAAILKYQKIINIVKKMELTEKLLSSDRVQFFSLARYALIEALKISGVNYGDCVLIPEYICNEVVAEIELNGIDILFYKVDYNLKPIGSPDKWPKAKAILIVNYFGFPQDIEPFQQYVKRVGAISIEDNAHGFLSRDGDGKWLGLRADIGVFSFRKSICLSDGAALFLNDNKHNFINRQMVFYGNGLNPFVKSKCLIKATPLFGNSLWIFSILLVRAYKRIVNVFGIRAYGAKNVYIRNPNKDLIKDLALFSFKERDEINRRRKLYYRMLSIAKINNLESLFIQLPGNVVPYCFPFRANKSEAMLIKGKIISLGLELFRWPNLPNNIADNANYRNIWIVNFL